MDIVIKHLDAGVQGVFEHLGEKHEKEPELTGLQILVEGRVPLGKPTFPIPSHLHFFIDTCIASALSNTFLQSSS